MPRATTYVGTFRGQNYTNDDKQNIRFIASELSLRNNEEYKLFLMVQVLDNTIPL
jgi:hypothetical protein